MLSNISLSSLSNLLSLPTFFPNALFKYWFEIAIAICFYMLMLTYAFIYCLLYYCIICCIQSSIYFCFQIYAAYVTSSFAFPLSLTLPFSALTFAFTIALSLRFTILSTYKNILGLSTSLTIFYTCCQNSNTNYKYYTNNLPTLRSKYQCITLILPMLQ